MKLRLALVGFGRVGQEFVRLMLHKRDWLLGVQGLDVEVTAIATRTKGSLLSEKALDLKRILNEIETRGTLAAYGPETTDMSAMSVIENCSADIMIELTTLNVHSGQPAIDHIKNAFRMGIDAVTANKGPVAIAYDDLKSLASSRNVRFRFEGTVMDGTPIFSLVERTLPGCTIEGLRGVLNSTTNFVLTMMTKGKSMDKALSEAQSQGIAEADPSMDIDGWDAAAKISALANVFMKARSTPSKVHRRGIRDIDLNSTNEATDKNRKIKLVASAERIGEEVITKVSPELVGPDSPFWSVDGTSSALTLKTDLMNNITIIEQKGGVTQTAYAVFSDMLLIAESISSCR